MRTRKRIIRWLVLLCGGLLPFILILVAGAALTGMLMAVAGQGEESKQEKFHSLSVEVEAYRDIVKKYTEQEGIPEYTDHILCIMEAETKGAGTDVMNAGAKESNTKYPKQRGSITDPSYSIECGVKECKVLLSLVGVTGPEDTENLFTLYQAYHFGRGYLSFLGNRPHAAELAAEYKAANGLGPEYDVNFSGTVAFYLASLGQGSGEFIWPLPLRYSTITSYFGYRIHPITGEYGDHSGTDISAPQGTPLYAIADGTVTLAEYGDPILGHYLRISHNGAYASVYGHCHELSVAAGQTVKQGEVIGYVGSTGLSTGPHLHLEMSLNGELLDALDYVSISKTGGETSE